MPDVVISSDLVNWLFGGVYVGGASLFLLLIILWKTPVMVFLKAMFTGGAINIIYNRSGRARFYAMKESAQGIMENKKTGPYLISERSNATEVYSGRPLYISFGEFGSTLPLVWIFCMNQLRKLKREKGEIVNNLDDLSKEIGRKYNFKEHKWESVKPTDEDQEIKIMPFETIKVHDLSNMFPWNITPSLNESRVVHHIALKQKLMNMFNAQFFVAVGFGALLLLIGATIFIKVYQGENPVQEVQAGISLAPKALTG